MIWFDGSFVNEANVSVLAHSLHYGGAVFEGIRFYNSAKGSAVFRLGDHVRRLFFSAEFVGMELPLSRERVCEVVLEAVKRSGLTQGYIRPLVFRGEGLGLSSAGSEAHLAVIVLPWKKSSTGIRLKVSSIIRLHPRSTVLQAKIAGHYVNSFLAAAEAKKSGADDSLLLDYKGNLGETSVANVFVVNGARVATPPADCIFAGITRDSVMRLCKYAGIAVEETDIALKMAWEAAAVFIAGTASEVCPVTELDSLAVPNCAVARKCRRLYNLAVMGNLEAFSHWLTCVK